MALDLPPLLLSPPEARNPDAPGRNFQMIFRVERKDGGYTLQASTASTLASRTFWMLVEKSLLAVAVMLVLCALGVAFFARMITRPIMRLAADTKRMAGLEDIPVPVGRNDEIGQLAQDICAMYGALKRTIADLEQEVEQERAGGDERAEEDGESGEVGEAGEPEDGEERQGKRRVRGWRRSRGRKG
jgi:methyl-accepting chemotaxis protein